jgi:hypothetical protein
MAEKQTVQEKEQKTIKEPKLKVKRPRQLVSTEKDNVIKLDLTKKKEDAVQEQSTNEIPVDDKPKVSKEVRGEDNKKSDEKPTEQKEEKLTSLEEIIDEPKKEEEEQKVVEEVKKEEPKAEDTTSEDIKQPEKEVISSKIPKDLQKLVDFMEDTGGTVEDYVSINKDYSNMDDHQMIRDHYKKTRPHLTDDEISFIMEDQFSYENEVDDERDIKRKKLAFKEEAAKARQHAEGLKNKYYTEIKSGRKLPPDQQKAIEFFDRYNKEKAKNDEIVNNQRSTFDNKTKQLFNKDFKGFEYKVGEKKFRFKVNNADSVKNEQSDINNFVKKFLNKENVMDDAHGYHKSLFTAMNADVVASHFYEQGKADAIKNSVERSKNVNMDPRGTHEGFVDTGGFKVRAVPDAENSDKLRVRFNNNKIT